MRHIAHCEACRRDFEAPPDRVGGFAPCPGCGKAVEIPGLSDPLYRLAQVGAVVGAVAVGFWVGQWAGLAAGLAAGVGVLAAMLLLRAAL